VTIDHSLIGNNISDVNGGGIRVTDYAQLEITNSIVWGSTPENVWNHFTHPVNMDVSHSIIGGYPALLEMGPGNMDVDPAFVDPSTGDYNLLAISPAIDAGDADRQHDPDGTRADIGPYPFNQSSLRLELPVTLRPVHGILAGDTVAVPIKAWLDAVRGVQLALVTDASMLVPADSASFLRGSAFAGLPDADGTWGVNGDTVRVALSSSDAITLSNQTIVELAFIAVADFYPGQVVPLTWVREHTPDGPAWALTVDDPTGIAGAEFTLVSDADGQLRVDGAGALAYNHSDGTLAIAVARSLEDDPVLFRVYTEAAVPELSRSELNEGNIGIAEVVMPPAFGLSQNAPNPFNPSTTIRFSLEAQGETQLIVYSVTGQHVRTLVSGSREAGRHSVTWDGTNDLGQAVASGVYIYRVVTPSGVATERMTLAR